MSLIEEALRRAQDPTVPKTDPTPTPQPASKETPATPPPHSWPITTPAGATPAMQAPPMARSLLAVSLVVLGISAALLVAGMRWLWGVRQSGRTTTGAHRAPTPAPSAAVQRAPAPPAPPVAVVTPPSTDLTPRVNPKESPAGGGKQDELVLNGVVEGLGEPYAMINGAIVGIGEQVGDATLLEIAHGAVKLRRSDGKDVVLRVPR